MANRKFRHVAIIGLAVVVVGFYFSNRLIESIKETLQLHSLKLGRLEDEALTQSEPLNPTEFHKELKVFLQWSVSDLEERKRLRQKIEDKFNSYLGPKTDAIAFKKYASAAMTYTRDLLHSSVLPPSTRDYFALFQPEVDHLNTLEQDDPALAEHVRKNLWVTPSPKNEPYHLQHPNKTDHSEGQLPTFLDVFKKEPIFYIECGGLDGEGFSNTLDFEIKYNWEGVLVEAAPENFEKLLTRKRKAALVATCLSLDKKPSMVKFYQGNHLGKISNVTQNDAKHVDVHCVPFYAVYQAIGRKDIDMFILDIEGHEVEVLQTIPWDKVNILTLMVEYINSKFKKEHMRDMMLNLGYREYAGPHKRGYWPTQNYFFIKKGSKYDVEHKG